MKTRKIRGAKSIWSRLFGRITRDENGAITMEYGLLALLIAAALVAVIMVFSTQIKNLFIGATKVAGQPSASDVSKTMDETNKMRKTTAEDQVKQAEAAHDKFSDSGTGSN